MMMMMMMMMTIRWDERRCSLGWGTLESQTDKDQMG